MLKRQIESMSALGKWRAWAIWQGFSNSLETSSTVVIAVPSDKSFTLNTTLNPTAPTFFCCFVPCNQLIHVCVSCCTKGIATSNSTKCPCCYDCDLAESMARRPPEVVMHLLTGLLFEFKACHKSFLAKAYQDHLDSGCSISSTVEHGPDFALKLTMALASWLRIYGRTRGWADPCSHSSSWDCLQWICRSPSVSEIHHAWARAANCPSLNHSTTATHLNGAF